MALFNSSRVKCHLIKRRVMVSTRSFWSTNRYTNPDLKCFRALTLSAAALRARILHSLFLTVRTSQFRIGRQMSTPLIATHPCTLLHEGLRHTLTQSTFRPVRILSAFSDEVATDIRSVPGSIWLVGVEKYNSTMNDLVRRVVATCPAVKAVILAAHLSPHDILAAAQSGACGFLSQDIPGEWLIKSLELIAHADMVVLPHLLTASNEWNAYSASQADSAGPQLSRLSSHASVAAEPENQPGFTGDLTRREILILRSLMEGASNKVIALKLVMTESTVKVHMKAILRKLKLQNRTQVAMWARDHSSELSCPAKEFLERRFGSIVESTRAVANVESRRARAVA